MIDIDDVKRLTLADGDLLVVKVNSPLSDAAVKRIKQVFGVEFPHLAGRVMVLDESMTIAVVAAPQGDS